MQSFDSYAYCYNAFYKDKDYAVEAKQVDTLINQYSQLETNRLILFGCGTGKHDFELMKLGYKTHGIDISPTMIEVAMRDAERIGAQDAFRVADVRDFKPEKQFDAVISLFHVMSYQCSNSDLMDTFASARRCLDVGGLFIFDSWYGPGVLTDLPSLRIKEADDDENHLIRIATPVMHNQSNTVDVNYTILMTSKSSSVTQTLQEEHHMRYFFKPEIDYYLQSSGFVLLDVLDCNTLGPTSYDSWTSYLRLR